MKSFPEILGLGKDEAIVAKNVYCFEEAVSKIGSGRFHILLLLVSGTSLLAVIIEGLNMAFVLPAAKCELNINSTEQGMINAVAFLGVVLTSHFWGFMADTWGRRKVMQMALGSGFAFSALSSLSTSSVMLLITRFCVGLCMAGVQAAAISYLGEFHSNRTRAKHVTFAAMFMTLSIVYQPLMGIFIMPRAWQFSLFGLMEIRPWRLYILISSCSSALAFLAISWLPESPKFELAMGRKAEALDILRRAFVANKMGTAEEFPVKELELLETSGSSLADAKGLGAMFRMVWTQTKPLLQKEHIGNVLMMCYIAFSNYAVAHGLYMWYPQLLALYYPYMEHPITTCGAVTLGYRNITITTHEQQVDMMTTGDDITDASACDVAAEPMTYHIILVMGCTFVSIYSFVALNSTRFGMKWLLSGWLVAAGLAGFALFWTDNFYVNTALIIALLSSGNNGSILSAVSADLFPTHFKGMALCFIMMSGRIGAVVGSNLIGVFLYGHCEYVFGVCTSMLLASVGICFYVLHKKERQVLSNS